MRRFFLKEKISNMIKITDSDAWHIKKVLRMQIGDVVQVVDICRKIAEAEIVSFVKVGKKIEINLKTVNEIKMLCEDRLALKVCLLQGLAKGSKVDWIVQKAVEIGVSEILIYQGTNSVVQLEKSKATEKKTRWQMIANEASKQCRSNFLTNIEVAFSLKEAIKQFSDNCKCFKRIIVLNEKEDFKGIRKAITNIKKESFNKEDFFLGIVIGPEGGFSEEEIKMMREVNGEIDFVTLGRRILRTETAAIAALAIVFYELK